MDEGAFAFDVNDEDIHMAVEGRLISDIGSAGARLHTGRSRNERNPYLLLPARKGGDSGETAADNAEEGGDDVKSSCPLWLGLHTYYNGSK